MRLHPGPGFASIAELWFRWSRHAAISHGRRARPGLRFRHRVRSRTTDYAVRLGRGQWFRRAYARMEDQVLVLAAQRTGKSGIVADRILDHPGPVLATSTRADLYESTAGARALPRPGARVQPAGRRRRAVVAGLGSPRPVQGPGDGPPDGVLAQGV